MAGKPKHTGNKVIEEDDKEAAEVERPKLKKPPPSTIGRRNKIPKFIKKQWKLLLTLLVSLVFIFLVYGYIHTKNQLNNLSGFSGRSQTEIQQITSKVSKTLQLPNETPTLATVSDANGLRSQTFFRNTQNGDKVLIYAKSGRALLYRPSAGKVIEYSLVTFSNSQ